MIDPSKPNFGGRPVASWRPRLDCEAAHPGAPPAVTIVTPFRDEGPAFLETADAVLAQSFQAFEWCIVDDGSRDPESLSLLRLLRERDPRIRVVTLAVQQGPGRARNTGFLAARAELVFALDADTQLEATALEKSFWALRSHADWSFATGWSVAHGEGGHRELRRDLDRLLDAAPPTAGALIRRDAFLHAGGFCDSLRDGYEVWDFWLRCADRGGAGGVIPEVLSWTTGPRPGDDPDRDGSFAADLRRRHARVARRAWPRREAPAADTRPLLDPPCRNRLKRRERRLLVALPSLAADGLGAWTLEMLAILVKRGWQATVACVRTASDEATAAYARLGADLHVLDRVVRAADQASYLAELVESRGPEWVLLGPGRFAQVVASHLRSRCSGPRYAELRHEDANDPAADLVLAAAPIARAIDVALVATPTANGAPAGAVEVEIPLAVDPTVWKPRSAPRAWMRPLWGAEPTDLVLLWTGPVEDPLALDVVAETIRALLHRGAPVRAVFAGAGRDREALRAFAQALGAADRIHFLDSQSNESLLKVYSACDVFFAPMRRGAPLAALRAMACGLPLAALATPEMSRWVDAHCGIAVPLRDTDATSRGLADAIEALAADPARRTALGRAARERVIAHFAPDSLATPLLATLGAGGSAHEVPSGDPRPASDAATFFVLLEALHEREVWEARLHSLSPRLAQAEANAAALESARGWYEDQLRHARTAAESQRARAATLESELGRLRARIDALEASERRMIDALAGRVLLEESRETR